MNEPKLVRKGSITDRAINKQKKILIIAVLCVITLFISSSYALLTSFDKTDNVITIKSGNLTVTIAADTVNLNDKLPESDESGLQGTTSTITLTNTGNIDIAGYDLKLVSETGTENVSNLDSKYVKYAISLDGTNYTDPKLLSSNNNVIYSNYGDYILKPNASKNFYLKVWIDENAGNNAVNKSFFASIKVDLYQKRNVPDGYSANLIKNQITKNTTSTCSNTKIEEDGVTYLSGSADCINFNYVWYSGKLWRITAINSDGTIKMITDDEITTIAYGADVNFYDVSKKNDSAYIGSYVYQFLNEDFLNTLYNHENIIVMDSTWYSLTTTNVSSKIASTTSGVVTINNKTINKNTPVGLINTYEYYLSYKNANYTQGYLNIGLYWWLLNPSSSTNGWYIYNEGDASADRAVTIGFGIRPAVNLVSNVLLYGGDGSKDNPYKIVGDKESATPNTTYLNTRSSGEYVIFDEDGNASTKELYRIVSTAADGTTKLNKNDYIRDSSNNVIKKFFSSIGKTRWGKDNNIDFWYEYLNNTTTGWYASLNATSKNLLTTGTYYTKFTESPYYKNALCGTPSTSSCTANDTASAMVGLPRYGEMFASIQENYFASSETIVLITPISDNQLWFLYQYGGSYADAISVTTRPSIHIKATAKITGGDGTKQNPFTIS